MDSDFDWHRRHYRGPVVRLTFWKALLLTGGFLAFSVVLLFVGIDSNRSKASQHLRALVQRGVNTSGRVTSVDILLGAKGHRYRLFVYEYSVANKRFTGRDSLEDPADFDTVTVGSEVPIRFLPDDPAISGYKVEDQVSRRGKFILVSSFIAGSSLLAMIVVILLRTKFQ